MLSIDLLTPNWHILCHYYSLLGKKADRCTYVLKCLKIDFPLKRYSSHSSRRTTKKNAFRFKFRATSSGTCFILHRHLYWRWITKHKTFFIQNTHTKYNDGKINKSIVSNKFGANIILTTVPRETSANWAKCSLLSIPHLDKCVFIWAVTCMCACNYNNNGKNSHF